MCMPTPGTSVMKLYQRSPIFPVRQVLSMSMPMSRRLRCFYRSRDSPSVSPFETYTNLVSLAYAVEMESGAADISVVLMGEELEVEEMLWSNVHIFPILSSGRNARMCRKPKMRRSLPLWFCHEASCHIILGCQYAPWWPPNSLGVSHTPKWRPLTQHFFLTFPFSLSS